MQRSEMIRSWFRKQVGCKMEHELWGRMLEMQTQMQMDDWS